MTEYQRWGGLKNINLFSHRSEGQKYKIKVTAGFVFHEVFFLGLQMVPFLVAASHGHLSVYVHPCCLAVCLNLFLQGHQSE